MLLRLPKRRQVDKLRKNKHSGRELCGYLKGSVKGNEPLEDPRGPGGQARFLDAGTAKSATSSAHVSLGTGACGSPHHHGIRGFAGSRFLVLWALLHCLKRGYLRKQHSSLRPQAPGAATRFKTKSTVLLRAVFHHPAGLVWESPSSFPPGLGACTPAVGYGR